ncbi:MAG: hypothetical protein H8E62_02475 [Planctomycetes bacterium]|nr:hypothetical protein [Planctomycetota bacterium]
MVIEAPLSRYKKQNFMIIIGILVGAAVIFGYDGYLSKYEWSMRYSFYKKHVVDNGGVPDGTMDFNQKYPPFFFLGGVIVAAYYIAVKGKKVLADEDALKTEKETITYDTIEKIDKTHFDNKGYFIITYKDSSGQNKDLKVSDRTYDNLGAVLDHVVEKIS